MANPRPNFFENSTELPRLTQKLLQNISTKWNTIQQPRPIIICLDTKKTEIKIAHSWYYQYSTDHRKQTQQDSFEDINSLTQNANNFSTNILIDNGSAI